MAERDLEFALDTKAEYESPKEMRVDGPAGGQWHRPSAVSGISMAFSGVVTQLEMPGLQNRKQGTEGWGTGK